MMKSLYFLYDPNSATSASDGPLDSAEMTAREAVQSNIVLQRAGNSTRWILASRWEEDVEFGSAPPDQHFQEISEDR